MPDPASDKLTTETGRAAARPGNKTISPGWRTPGIASYQRKEVSQAPIPAGLADGLKLPTPNRKKRPEKAAFQRVA
jgi:hypothetical protein